MSTPPSPNDLTRQQLDELDSLLQRMLTLPQSGPREVAEPQPTPVPMPEMPAAPSGSWRADAPAAAAKAPYLTGEPAAQPVTAPAWGPTPLARYGMAPAPEPPRLFAPPT